MQTESTLCEYFSDPGIAYPTSVVRNPDYEMLFQAKTRDDLEGHERVRLTESGAVAVDTGIFTGRSPADTKLARNSVHRVHYNVS